MFFLRLSVFSVLSVLLMPISVFAVEEGEEIQWSFDLVHAPMLWEETLHTKDTVIAIIDNGFDHYHPDLNDNVWQNQDEIPGNGIDDDKNGYIDDRWGWDFVRVDRNNDGDIDASESLGDNNPRPSVRELREDEKANKILHHGTVVAGIIGAEHDNTIPSQGILKQVQLMNIRLVDETGEGEVTHFSRAIRYAVDNGADVINLSFVANVLTSDMTAALEYAYAQGVPIIAAAGNTQRFLNEDPRYPICIDSDEDQRVLGVSAIDQRRYLASFSNFGDCIDITAPGIDIQSTLRWAPKEGLSEQYSQGWSGTSFAAPFVSAAAAVVQSIHPDWSVKEIITALTQTTQKTPSDDEVLYAQLFGAGLIQLDKVFQYADERREDIDGDQTVWWVIEDKEKTDILYQQNDQEEQTLLSLDASIDGIEKKGSTLLWASFVDASEDRLAVTIKTEEKQAYARWEITVNDNPLIFLTDLGGNTDMEALVVDQDERILRTRRVNHSGELQEAFSVLLNKGDVVKDVFVSAHDDTQNKDVFFLIAGEQDRILQYMHSSKETKEIRLATKKRVHKLIVRDMPERQYIVSGNSSAMAIWRYDAEGALITRQYPFRRLRGIAINMLQADYLGNGEDEIIIWQDNTQKRDVLILDSLFRVQEMRRLPRRASLFAVQ